MRSNVAVSAARSSDDGLGVVCLAGHGLHDVAQPGHKLRLDVHLGRLGLNLNVPGARSWAALARLAACASSRSVRSSFQSSALILPAT